MQMQNDIMNDIEARWADVSGEGSAIRRQARDDTRFLLRVIMYARRDLTAERTSASEHRKEAEDYKAAFINEQKLAEQAEATVLALREGYRDIDGVWHGKLSELQAAVREAQEQRTLERVALERALTECKNELVRLKFIRELGGPQEEHWDNLARYFDEILRPSGAEEEKSWQDRFPGHGGL